MGCACALDKTIKRLYPGASDDLLFIAEQVDNVDKDARAFLTHMDLEDEYIREHLDEHDQATMDAHHKRMRACHVAGRPIDPEFFRKHASWEAQLFSRLGR